MIIYRLLTVLLLSAIIPLWPSWVVGQEAPKTAVALTPIQFYGTDSGKDITRGINTILAVDLAGVPGMSVIPAERTMAFLAGEKGASPLMGQEEMKRMVEGLGARYLLSGSFLAVGSKFRLDLQVIDLRTGDVRFLDKVQGGEDHFLDLLTDLSGKVVGWFGGVSPVKGGELELTTAPEGAQVFLDEELFGTTPLKKKGVEAGNYQLRLELGGYQNVEERVVVRDREKTSRSWSLKRLNGGIRVWWKTKVDSDVRLGAERLLIPQGVRYSRNLPAGEYEIETRIAYTDESSWEHNKGWRTYTATVTVEPEQVVDVFIDNSMLDPGIRVSRCSECETGWDWKTHLVWYEQGVTGGGSGY